MPEDDSIAFTINVIGKKMKKWAVAYGNSLDTTTKQEYAANHFDLVDNPPLSVIPYMKGINPNLKCIFYKVNNEIYGPPYPQPYDDWAVVNANEPWFLHWGVPNPLVDQAHRIQTCAMNGHYMLNPDPSVGWGQHLAGWIYDKINAEAWDGVFVDNGGRYVGSFGCTSSTCSCDVNGNPLSLSQIAPNVQTSYPFTGVTNNGPPPTWTYSCIQTIRNNNIGKIIMVNAGYAWDIAVDFYPEVILCIEGWTGDTWWGSQYYQWRIMDWTWRYLNENSKIAVITEHTKDRTNIEAIRFWLLHNYCLFALSIHNPDNSYFCYQKDYGSLYPATDGYWFSEMDTVLGNPLDDFFPIIGTGTPGQGTAPNYYDAVYARHFEYATIILNLSMGGGLGTQKTWTFTLDGVQYTLAPDEGKIVPL